MDQPSRYLQTLLQLFHRVRPCQNFLCWNLFFLSKFGFTAAPVVLGIILGPIAETNFNQAKIIADTQNGIFDYLTAGPLNLTIIALCLISILYGAYGDKAKKEKK